MCLSLEALKFLTLSQQLIFFPKVHKTQAQIGHTLLSSDLTQGERSLAVQAGHIVFNLTSTNDSLLPLFVNAILEV